MKCEMSNRDGLQKVDFVIFVFIISTLVLCFMIVCHVNYVATALHCISLCRMDIVMSIITYIMTQRYTVSEYVMSYSP